MFPLPRLACELTDAAKRISRRRKLVARSHPRPPLPAGGPDGNAHSNPPATPISLAGASGLRDVADRGFSL